MKKIINALKKDTVLAVSLALALASCFISRPSINYIDFKVIISLFNLMLVICGLKALKVLDWAAIKIITKCSSTRRVSLMLILLCFFFSMLVTNDVALITFVPLTLIIGDKMNINPMMSIIFQTIAANIGSSLTPIGNPQNLYLFTHYNISIIEFLKIMSPFVIIGLIWVVILNLKIKDENISLQLEKIEIQDKRQVFVFFMLLLITILSVLNIISYWLVFIIALITATILRPKLFKEVDYLLLLTFICFFIFVGNISNMSFINKFMQAFLGNKIYTYLTSIILSQFISNVPSAILLAGFTDNYRYLLLGANIGGMGTLIASLASLIAYRIYINNYNKAKRSDFLKSFTIYNFISLFLITIIIGIINF